MKIMCCNECCADGLIVEGRIIDKNDRYHFQTAGDEWLVREKYGSEILLYVPFPMCGSDHGHKMFRILEV